MKLLDVVHPAAKTLVDVSLSQDAEVSRDPSAGPDSGWLLTPSKTAIAAPCTQQHGTI
jgi:hypothetical protein